jgi:hypothetical protein
MVQNLNLEFLETPIWSSIWRWYPSTKPSFTSTLPNVCSHPETRRKEILISHRRFRWRPWQVFSSSGLILVSWSICLLLRHCIWYPTCICCLLRGSLIALEL